MDCKLQTTSDTDLQRSKRRLRFELQTLGKTNKEGLFHYVFIFIYIKREFKPFVAVVVVSVSEWHSEIRFPGRKQNLSPFSALA